MRFKTLLILLLSTTALFAQPQIDVNVSYPIPIDYPDKGIFSADFRLNIPVSKNGLYLSFGPTYNLFETQYQIENYGVDLGLNKEFKNETFYVHPFFYLGYTAFKHSYNKESQGLQAEFGVNINPAKLNWLGLHLCYKHFVINASENSRNYPQSTFGVYAVGLNFHL